MEMFIYLAQIVALRRGTNCSTRKISPGNWLLYIHRCSYTHGSMKYAECIPTVGLNLSSYCPATNVRIAYEQKH